MAEPGTYRTPGQFIGALLAERGWNQRALAIVLGVGETIVNRIIAGKRPVDAEMAIALGDLFGVDPVGFMQLQLTFDLELARISARPDPRRPIRARLFGDLPIAEMIDRGWLPGVNSIKDVAAVETALARFFGVPSADEIPILPHAAKKTDALERATPVQLTWIHRVRQVANELLVPAFNPAAGRAAVTKLARLLNSAAEARKVPRILAEAGIRYVLVEPLPGTKIDGVCTWLDATSPVIGMTCRRDTIDNFWFVLRHELEHVLCEHGRSTIMLDVELEGERAGVGDGIADEERVANAAAAEFCVSQKALSNFIARKAPFFAERDIIGFARTQQVHPGLVAGQIQHRTGQYDRFRAHQVKIRSIVRPSAMTDGWGDVAPTEM
jgi:HTH-type transcriptional regulator/antitoxin HigA